MLRPEKAHEVFLQTAKKILKEMPEVHFIIIGDGPLRQKLEAYSSELGISAHVHFLGLRQDVSDILQELDVAVLSSHPIVETLSVAVLEYMAAGKPVVATRVGSIPELVHDGENGYLVDPGDSEALANRIMRLLKNPALAEKMGKAGQARVTVQYTAESMVEKTQSFFSELLEQRAGV
jgi:glycosyltransferase involved in cell wall biosynthesis